MQIKDIGVIIANRPLKEQHNIISVFTKQNGLYKAVVSVRSKKDRLIYQVGNLVDFNWKARLHEHIGFCRCELIKSYISYVINSKIKLIAFNSLISIILQAFHEREPHNNFFPILDAYLNCQSQDFVFADYVKLELAILYETGFELDLSACAVTGKKDQLTYVSPKSGKAVSQEAGLPYHDKLLILPAFLMLSTTHKKSEITLTDKLDSLKLTEYFFKRYLLKQDLPQERYLFEKLIVEFQ